MTATAALVPVGASLFSDDFNGAAGSKPDPTKWIAAKRTAKSGTVFDGLNEIQLDGQGNLVIAARKINGKWYSGELVGKQSFKGPYYAETLAKVAAGAGTWSAPLWLWAYPSGVSGVEVDVCEQLGSQPSGMHTTVHAAGGAAQRTVLNNVGVILANDFHVYGCAMHTDHADFYLDNKLIRTIKPTDGELAGRWPFTTTEMCALTDLDMGGWGGAVAASVTAPKMLVASINVYELLA